jgi:YD repeat-containing protein
LWIPRNYTSHTDELSYTSGYGFDDLGRLNLISLPGAIVTQLGYDKSGNLLSVINPRGFETDYEYDGRNRLKKVTEADPDGTGPLTSPVTTYTYNDANELVTVTDPRGFVTTYTYDGLSRLKTVTSPIPMAAAVRPAPSGPTPTMRPAGSSAFSIRREFYRVRVRRFGPAHSVIEADPTAADRWPARQPASATMPSATCCRSPIHSPRHQLPVRRPGLADCRDRAQPRRRTTSSPTTRPATC